MTVALSATLSPNQSLQPVSATSNEKGHLTIGGCDVVDLATTFGTPLYIVDEETIRTTCQQYKQSFERFYPGRSQVLFATKAWNCLAICALVAQEGLGLDVVSGGELTTALEAGVSGDRIYLHGNYKSQAELEFAIASGVTIVVDNSHELEHLITVGQPARIMLRVTPGIECHTHEYIRTGHLDSKFGFDPNQIAAAFASVAAAPHLNCVGIHAHIGSQIFELQPHQDLGGVMLQIWQQGLAAGLPLSELNIGGGLGIRYRSDDDPPAIATWVETVARGVSAAFTAAGLPLPLLLSEPGRSLVGTSTITAYTVGGKKEIPGIRTYVSVDGGMSDNPRPITYQAAYTALVANRPDAAATTTVTIAGKHCESGDVLLRDAHLPELNSGDILVVLSTGAYNYSMASNYNRLPRPAAVLVREGQATPIIERETWADLLRQDRLPSYLR